MYESRAGSFLKSHHILAFHSAPFALAMMWESIYPEKTHPPKIGVLRTIRMEPIQSLIWLFFHLYLRTFFPFFNGA